MKLLVVFLTGMLTCMVGFPIYHNGTSSLKNLLIMVTAVGITQIIMDYRAAKDT